MDSKSQCLMESEMPIADLSKGQQVFEDATALFFVDYSQDKITCLEENEIPLENLSKQQVILEESIGSLYFVDPLSPAPNKIKNTTENVKTERVCKPNRTKGVLKTKTNCIKTRNGLKKILKTKSEKSNCEKNCDADSKEFFSQCLKLSHKPSDVT